MQIECEAEKTAFRIYPVVYIEVHWVPTAKFPFSKQRAPGLQLTSLFQELLDHLKRQGREFEHREKETSSFPQSTFPDDQSKKESQIPQDSFLEE